MSKKLCPKGLPEFNLLLKSHSQKKRLYEAKEKLLSVYPFEVSVQNIILFKTDKKNIYNVYISKEKIKKEINIFKLAVMIFSILFIFSAFIFIMHRVEIKNTERSQMLKEAEKQRLEEDSIKKEKKENLKKVQNEYLEMKDSSYEKIYPLIERIYSASLGDTTIENLSIEKNLFTVEVTTGDAVKILSKFEESPAFTAVKMNRSSIKNGKEMVSYSGEFSRLVKEADENLSVDEKINFYSKEINIMKELLNRRCNVQLSEYIKNIRNNLHKNNCYEQYIQIKGKKQNTEIEFFIFSESKNILNFIRDIQDNTDSLVDIKSIKIHNGEDGKRIQTTIIFSSGIELNHKEEVLEYDDVKIDVSEIDKIFYKTPTVKTTAPKTTVIKTPEVQKTKQPLLPKSLKTLSYIGLTKSGGMTLVLVKDEEMKTIYKLPFTEKEINEDCCIKKNGEYIAKVRGEYYEVKNE